MIAIINLAARARPHAALFDLLPRAAAVYGKARNAESIAPFRAAPAARNGAMARFLRPVKS